MTFTTEDSEIIKNAMEQCIIQMSNLDNFLNDCKDLFQYKKYLGKIPIEKDHKEAILYVQKFIKDNIPRQPKTS